MAYVISPDGVLGEVPDEQLQAATSAGYKPRKPTAQELARKQAADEPLQAAGEGVLRGASMGLSDPLLVGMGVKREGLKLRKEENPVVAGASELGGVAAATYLTGGGASALAGGGVRGAVVESGLYGMGSMISESALDNTQLTTERLAAGFMGGALAGGGAHMALSAAGKAVSLGVSKFGGGALRDTAAKAADDILYAAATKGMPQEWLARNAPYKEEFLKSLKKAGVTAFDQANLGKVTAEKQVLGAAVGQQLTTLEQYVPLKKNAGLRNEMADYIEKRLEPYRDSPAYDDALKESKKYIDSLRERDRTWSAAWEDIQQKLFKDADPTKTAVGEVREEIRQSMRDFVFNDVASGKNKAGKVLTASWAPESLGAAKGAKAIPLQAPLTVNLSPSESAGAALEVAAAPTRIEGFAPALRGTQVLGADVGTLPTGRDIPGALGRTRSAVSVEGGVSTPGGIFEFPNTERFVTAGAAPEGRVALNRTGAFVPEGGIPGAREPLTVNLNEAGPQRAGGLVFDAPAVASPEWLGAQMRQTGRDFRSMAAVEKAIAKRAHALDKGGSLGDTLMLGLVTGNPLGVAAAGLAKEQVERRGAFLSASVLNAISDSKVMQGVSRGLAEHLSKVMAVAPELLGTYRYALANAAAQGTDALLAEHLRLASGPEGQDYMARAALPVESPEEVDAAGQRLAVLDSMQRLADQQGEEMDRAVDGIFGATPGRKGGGIGTSLSQKEFLKLKGQFDAAMASPEAAFEGIPPELRAAAPAAATQTAAASMQAMQYLMSKAPKNPYEGMPPTIAPQWSPSAAELDQFNRYREAVVAPASVLKNMAKGYIAPEQVEALQAVYPAMYAKLQEQISERMMMLKKPLSYQQRLALAAVIGPGALSMSPQQVQILQQSQGLASGKDSGQGKPMKGPDGRQDVNEAQIQTEAQKLEAR